MKESGTALGFWGGLQLTFIILKLCKVITWSWWLVLLPMIIPIAISLFLGIIAIIVYAVSK